MTAEQIVALRFHGGTSDDQTSTDTSSFNLIEQGSVSGVTRLTYNADSFAADVAWINQVQAAAEGTEFGIPYINSRDPASTLGMPSNSISFASTFDKDLMRKAGMWQGRTWRSMGVTCELGPQIDLYTQLRGTRCSGGPSNDPALSRDFAAAFGAGMQSTWGDDEASEDLGWGKDSVGIMMKHFVGEGSNEGGRDDHSMMGEWDVFPGGQFQAHLVPFLDGAMNLDSSTGSAAACMPCYGIAYDPNDPEGLGEWCGAGFSEYLLSGLRNAGFDGMITTDWMISGLTGHGTVTELTTAERLKKMYGVSVDQHGGSFEVEAGAEALQALIDEVGEEEATASYRESAERIFNFMHKVQLFDNPYSDRSAAKAMLENEAGLAFGEELTTKSVIMLKNDGTISEAGLDGKVYVPQFYNATVPGIFGDTPANIAPAFDVSLLEGLDIVTDTVGDYTGEPAEEGGDPTPQQSDITRLTADELADVKYAIIRIASPNDAYQGVEGGPSMWAMMFGADPASLPPAVYRPISLQYRPYVADGENVRKTSLNPDADTDNRAYFGADTYATNECLLDQVLEVKAALPEGAKLILCIDADRPMVFSEIEPAADVILLAFVTPSDTGFANIIKGAVEPYGLLNHPMPASMDAVEALNEDTPRSVECYVDAAGNTYEFAFGLNWSGVIDDDRTATYKADPLTGPETVEWAPTV